MLLADAERSFNSHLLPRSMYENALPLQARLVHTKFACPILNEEMKQEDEVGRASQRLVVLK